MDSFTYPARIYRVLTTHQAAGWRRDTQWPKDADSAAGNGVVGNSNLSEPRLLHM